MQSNKTGQVYLIAEIGVNHGGDVAVAKKMIAAAKQAGADAVKFQTFTAAALVSPDTAKVKYQETTTDRGESHFQMIKSLEFKREDHLPVIDFCKELNIDFISTPYDVDSARFLHELGVEIFKTASADIVDIFLHKFLASTGKKVIISTGMATMGEIENILSYYEDNSKVTLLHCVSNYPCAYESLNLSVMNTLAQTFQVPVGYSDHAVGPYPAVMSVVLGATIVEKHFTLNKEMEGPDHKASSTPEEFQQLVSAIRIAERSLGNPVKKVQDEEKQMRKVSRKSLFLKDNVIQGHVLTESDFSLKRPGDGIYSTYISSVVGKKATCNLVEGEMLKLGDFGD